MSYIKHLEHKLVRLVSIRKVTKEGLQLMLSAKHIHDTLTSGLQLDIDHDTYTSLTKALKRLNGKTGERKFKNGKSYRWQVFLKNEGQTFGANNITISSSWLTALIKPNGEVFTKIGLKLRKVSKNYFINITANPTAIMRCDYATHPATSNNTLSILTSPFRAIEAMTGPVFSEKDWATIQSGNITLHNIEIAFPLKTDIGKANILVAMNRIYGSRISLADNVFGLGDLLSFNFSRYPDNVTNLDNVTGVSIQAFSSDQAHQLFTLTLYDKIAEMAAKKKSTDDDLSRWQKYLRVDIRVFPAFMRQLIGKQERFTLADWIALEDKHDNFSAFLWGTIANHLALESFLQPISRITKFKLSMTNEFGKDTANKWTQSTKYKASAFCNDVGINSREFYRFMAREKMPVKIGGLPYYMANAFNLTTGLRLDDLAQVEDINDLAKLVNKRKQQSNFDEWEDLKSQMLTLCR